MTKEELEKATRQELIEQRDYCGVDGYYGDYFDNVNAEMLKRFNRLAELEQKLEIERSSRIALVNKIAELEKENAEAKNLIEELASSLSVVGECGEEECELINKAQKFINKPIF